MNNEQEKSNEVKPEDKKKHEFTIEDVLPYSVVTEENKDKNCKVCGRPNSQHAYMDIFLHPPHVLAIRNFLNNLQKKHDKAKMLTLKLATTTPKSVLSPKEIQQNLIDKEYNPKFATQLIQQSVHYAPSQELAFKHRGIGEKLWTARVRYDTFADFWEHEFLCHKRLANNEEKTLENALKQMITQPFYKDFLAVHGLDAEIDYRFVQKEVHQVTATVEANLTLTEEYLKEHDPLVTAGMDTARKSRERVSGLGITPELLDVVRKLKNQRIRSPTI